MCSASEFAPLVGAACRFKTSTVVFFHVTALGGDIFFPFREVVDVISLSFLLLVLFFYSAPAMMEGKLGFRPAGSVRPLSSVWDAQTQCAQGCPSRARTARPFSLLHSHAHSDTVPVKHVMCWSAITDSTAPKIPCSTTISGRSTLIIEGLCRDLFS